MNSVALTPATKARSTEMARRVESLGWQQIAVDLDAYGCAMAKGVLLGDECRELAALYRQDAPFRSRIAMSRHGFGRGEYKYWAYPLPETVATLRNTLYPYLAEVANRWNRLMKIEVRYPAQHATYLAQCHQAGQTKPTPLLLQYGEGDFNCLHQDVYGDRVFPLQATFLLSVPGKDFTGGEFVLTEQRPRIQSRAEVVSLEEGDGVIFAVDQRPVQGIRGAYLVNLRHGVSRIRSGHRHTMGMIFHDAK
jgi:hypothetical protein